MTDAADTYRELLMRLLELRENSAAGVLSDETESEFAAELDRQWWAMTAPERDDIELEFGKVPDCELDPAGELALLVRAGQALRAGAVLDKAALLKALPEEARAATEWEGWGLAAADDAAEVIETAARGNLSNEDAALVVEACERARSLCCLSNARLAAALEAGTETREWAACSTTLDGVLAHIRFRVEESNVGARLLDGIRASQQGTGASVARFQALSRHDPEAWWLEPFRDSSAARSMASAFANVQAARALSGLVRNAYLEYPYLRRRILVHLGMLLEPRAPARWTEVIEHARSAVDPAELKREIAALSNQLRPAAAPSGEAAPTREFPAYARRSGVSHSLPTISSHVS